MLDGSHAKRKERQTLIWEHLGMMDNEGYALNALERILRYERNGYFPGKNLILTHETSRNPMDIQIVKRTIQTYLQ